jgi:hypothetical protein
MSTLSKVKTRRIASRDSARAALQAIVGGKAEIYTEYRRLYGLWCSNNSAVPELRPLFRLDGIEPDGALCVNDEFRQRVYSAATIILQQLTDDKT